MQLKSYQQHTLDALQSYLEALAQAQAKAAQVAALNIGITYEWDREAWKQVRGSAAYTQRQSGAGEPVPAVCLKIPTGGGKTLLAVKAIDSINNHYRRGQHGLVLWIVPTTQIYRQTLSALRDRTHPYRQLLDLSSGGKTLILEKDAVFTPADIAAHLAVFLLMLPAANRQNKETLRLFRDQGGFEAFFPTEDQWQAHSALLARVPNLDTFEATTFTDQRLVKTSLGNTLRLLNPLVVLDEGHKAYSIGAQETLLGFNPAFVLELSATPPKESNVLVQISGREVHREGMIKLDLHLNLKASPDWRDTLLASHVQRVALEQTAQRYAMNGGDYIRPICLVQVERTGAKQRGSGLIHAEDVRAFLTEKCQVLPEEIAVKSSERDEIEQIDLLSDTCPIRYIITKQALQEGWDCPFAYVLAVLTNAEASASITQLVGRVLRQPYARKTGIPALDESYVYCFRAQTTKALQAVQAGLGQEGLGDVSGRVVIESETNITERVDIFVRPEHRNLVGKVYLPCFVVADKRGGWREIRYEVDVLSRVDWDQVRLDPFADLELNPELRQDQIVRVNTGNPIPGVATSTATDGPIDHVFITRQIIDIVPSPWSAYAFVQQALTLLRRRYDDDRIRRDIGFVIEELKKLLRKERDLLAEAAFRAMIEQGELHFYLISGVAGAAIPDRITMPSHTRRLTTAVGAPLQRTLFEYEPEEEFNRLESAVALYLDQQDWVLAWYRNVVHVGYSIQGWRPPKVYPDFIALQRDQAPNPAEQCLSAVRVLETKGLHLKNDDTDYKRALFALCDERSRPTPWDAVAQDFVDHKVHFQVLFEDEWERVLNALVAP